MILALACFALLLSALPLLMFCKNMPLFCDPIEQLDVEAKEHQPGVSLLIPARDEEASIADCLQAALASDAVDLEVIVLDDNSEDQTAAIVQSFCDQDQRVKLIQGQELPEGWNGKQYACYQLAEAASKDHLAFIDADVRLANHCLAKLAHYLADHDLGLVSAFPRQITASWSEHWLIPMMHFILLGYLPLERMRQMADPSLAAGCGQLFLTTAEAYQEAGTHEAIRNSRHDGIMLPRAYRTAGLMSDVLDGTDLAEVRMYEGVAQVTRGLLKNASEGIAKPKLIVVFSVLLLGCSLLPLGVVIAAAMTHQWIALSIAVVALIMGQVPRLYAAAKFRQSWFGALCHIPATTVFVCLQWQALLNQLTGRKVAWRGRST